MSTIKNKIRALRLAHLVQSLGWDGARDYLAKLSPREKEDYFVPKNRDTDKESDS